MTAPSIAKKVAEARAEYEQQRVCWQLAHAFLDTVKVRRAEGNRLKPEAVEVMHARDQEQSEFISMTSKAWAVLEITNSPEYRAEVERQVGVLENNAMAEGETNALSGPYRSSKQHEKYTAAARAALVEFVLGVKP